MVLFCAFLGLYSLCHSHISFPNNATRHTQQNLVNVLLYFKSLYIHYYYYYYYYYFKQAKIHLGSICNKKKVTSVCLRTEGKEV